MVLEQLFSLLGADGVLEVRGNALHHDADLLGVLVEVIDLVG